MTQEEGGGACKGSRVKVSSFRGVSFCQLFLGVGFMVWDFARAGEKKMGGESVCGGFWGYDPV